MIDAINRLAAELGESYVRLIDQYCADALLPAARLNVKVGIERSGLNRVRILVGRYLYAEVWIDYTVMAVNGCRFLTPIPESLV